MGNEKTGASMRDYQIIRRPLITEKAATQGEGTVVFEVDRRASKDVIKAAIERVFSVQVAKVRTANYRGKLKRTMRSVGRRPDWKKAYITLQPGSSIEIVEGV